MAGAAFLFGIIDVALIATSDYLPLRGAWVVFGLIVGWGFIGTGLFAWSRRPENRVGMLMTATGFAWFIGGLGLSDVPVLFTFGNLLSSLYFAIALHMLLSTPLGTLHSRAERRLVAAAYTVSTLGVLPLYLTIDPQQDAGCEGCPQNVILVEQSETFANAWGILVNLAGVAIVIAVLVVLIRRWRRAPAPERRLYAPVYASGIALMVALTASLALSSLGTEGAGERVGWFVTLVPLALMPYVFLAALIRARMIQSGAVGELIARIGGAPRRGELRDALARALDDPSLDLVYWLPGDERFVDAEGRPFELPEDDPKRAVTKVEREGDCVAAIVYDASLRDAREHVDAVGAAAALALENERLDAALRAKVEELRASRQRMLRIGLEERRRLERDLHDGAQQRLVSMALNLRLARSRLRDDPDGADTLLASAGEELDAALEELRELARGIHPAVLSDRGLATALETLARRAPVPVELGALPGERLPEAVELAAYFVVSEALTNVAKYAQASHATVNVDRDNGRVVVEVKDDGVGGADPANGTGLRGLADRLAVIEGRLDVDSRAGSGTTVIARIPCA